MKVLWRRNNKAPVQFVLVYSQNSFPVYLYVYEPKNKNTFRFPQLLGFIRAPGFNRLPSPGEEVVLSFLPHASVASQTIDIFYTMSIAGTLCFVESRYTTQHERSRN